MAGKNRVHSRRERDAGRLAGGSTMFIKKLCLTAFLFYLSMTSQEIKNSRTSEAMVSQFDFGSQGQTELPADTEAQNGAALHKTGAELAAELEAFGIDIPDALVQEMDDSYDAYPEMYSDYLEFDPAFEYRTLLSYYGMGSYDGRWNWIPSSNQVYSFDCEVFNLDTMYTEFMTGVVAIGGVEFEITDVTENTDNVDYDKGIGTQVLSFRYNGTPYTYEAEFYGDWLDCGVIAFMNGVFEAEGNPKRLLATDDGGQGCILLYNTEEWGRELEARTGLELETYFY